jgi:integrase
MGRKATKRGAIPRFRVRKRGATRYYFYDHGIVDGKRCEESLGTDYGLAIKQWAELERASTLPPPAVVLFRYVGEQYILAAESGTLPRKKEPRTIADNRKELAKLLEFFDDPPAPLEAIKPKNVREYMNWRGATARVRANREKSLLSAIWNFARDKGYTDLPNPCAGIKGFAEEGRKVYIEDTEFEAVWQAADACLRDAMDLAYLTGQRPADVLSWSEDDVRDGVLYVRQGKTGEKLRFATEGDLADVLARIAERKAGYRVRCARLVVNQYGRSIGTNAMSRHWKAACEAAGVEGIQFRDLRAKAGTDTAESAGDIRKAQRQLGHRSVRMTEHYVRNRRGELVSPTLRKSPKIAEKENAPEGASNMEAGVGIEPAYADLQSGRGSRRGKGLH